MFQTLVDGPGVQRFESYDFEKEKIKRALDEIGWLAHDFARLPRTEYHDLTSVSKGKAARRTPDAGG
jgi:hypothetical protein